MLLVDDIYQQKQEQVENFCFDEKVANVFDDMINRSVPGYSTINHYSTIIASNYLKDGDTCYDLGCSTGDNLYNLRQLLQAKAHLIGVDNSTAMLDKCQQKLSQQTSNIAYTLEYGDICELNLKRAAVYLMNFTLQFILPHKRLTLLTKIHTNLKENGVLVLAEKIKFSSADEQDNFDIWHKMFKKSQGYSDLEIQQKRAAIENTLIADTLEQHMSRLTRIGFNKVYKACQFLNFVLLVAVK